MAGTIDGQIGNRASQDRIRLVTGLGGLVAILAIQALGATMIPGPQVGRWPQAGHEASPVSMRLLRDFRFGR